MSWLNFFRKKKIEIKPEKIKAKCGHLVDPNGPQTWCDECYDKLSITCAWCGLFIPVDGIVTLFTPDQGDNVHKDAVWFDNGVIGCHRNTCCSSCGDYVGQLTEDHKIARFTVPIKEVSL